MENKQARMLFEALKPWGSLALPKLIQMKEVCAEDLKLIEDIDIRISIYQESRKENK